MVDKSKVRMRIAELRKNRADITQEEFAALLGKSVDTISNYERGKTGTDVIQLVVRMCEILRCRVDELIEYIDDGEANDDYDIADQKPEEDHNPYDSLRNWWKRIIHADRILGEKEIEGIIDIIKLRSEFTKDSDIPKIFSTDDDLESKLKELIEEYENDQKHRLDLTALDTSQIRLDMLSKDPDRCACIFAYLKTRDNQFLMSLSSTIKRLAKNM
jgi:transcriptional regulator with XRE-family HTH domain